MRISYWPNSVAMNAKPVYDALLSSLDSAGYILEKENVDADAAVIWSVLWHGRMLPNRCVWEHYRGCKKPVLVAEVGGIERGKTWRIGLNGINRSACFGAINNNNHRALQLNLSTKPWQTNGDYILICGQHTQSLQWENMPPMSSWLMAIIEHIQQHSKRDIVFRPHPRCRLLDIELQYHRVYRQEPKLQPDTYDDFDLSLDNVHAVVNWSSNPGIDAIVNGVAAFVGPESLAYDVSSHDLCSIDSPQYKDRTQWINDLAWKEFTVEEIAHGLPLSRLRQTLNTEIINAMI